MDVKPGYKQTEIGLIPEQWAITKLGKHVAFRTGPFGSTLHKSDYVDGGIPLINPMQIIDGRLQPTLSMAVTEHTARELADFRLLTGDIVIGRRGDMGRCAVVQPDQHGWLCGTGSMIVRTGPSLDCRFIQRVLSSPPIIAEIESASVGSTMINLNQGTLGNLLIPLPPTRTEQAAIADALTDADALIDSLAQLLAKKRNLKQGAMQELLTGKRRLPGFESKPGYKQSAVGIIPEDWHERLLGQIAYIKTGHRNNEDKVDDGAYQFFVRSSKIERIDTYSYDCEAILVPGEGNIGDVVHYANGRFDVHQRVYAITRFSPDVVAKFAFYYLKLHFGRHAMNHTVKATVDSLRLPTFSQFNITLPSTRIEQEAIAAVLSDMDAEIATIEAKLAKTRQLKQGMMQELLTGRTRLV